MPIVHLRSKDFAGNLRTRVSAWARKQFLDSSALDVNLLPMKILQRLRDRQERSGKSRRTVPRSPLRPRKSQAHFPCQRPTCRTAAMFLGLMRKQIQSNRRDVSSEVRRLSIMSNERGSPRYPLLPITHYWTATVKLR